MIWLSGPGLGAHEHPLLAFPLLVCCQRRSEPYWGTTVCELRARFGLSTPHNRVLIPSLLVSVNQFVCIVNSGCVVKLKPVSPWMLRINRHQKRDD